MDWLETKLGKGWMSKGMQDFEIYVAETLWQ